MLAPIARGEPVVEEPAPTAAEHAETADSLSLGFLVLLESLSPVQRAVFLLHDVFDYDFREIAAIVGKSEHNCRQPCVRGDASKSANHASTRRESNATNSRAASSTRSKTAIRKGCYRCSPPMWWSMETVAARRLPGRGRSSAASRLLGCSPASAHRFRAWGYADKRSP